MARAGRRQCDRAQRAALDVIRNHPLAQNERALLLSDDRDIGRVIVIDPDKLILLTTWTICGSLRKRSASSWRMR